MTKQYYEAHREEMLAYQKAYNRAHPLKSVWQGMLQRCGLRKGGHAGDLARYAEKGVTVYDEWRHFRSFEAWALANGWRKGLELDRIDNDGPYAPWNCRFVTRSQNQRNKCNTIFAAGIPLATWYDAYKVKMNELGLSYPTVQSRFSKLGWSLEDSLFTPRRTH